MLYASERHNYMTGCPEADCHRAIRDHPIHVRSPAAGHRRRRSSFADFRAGRDPAMEAIVSDIRSRRVRLSYEQF